MKEARVRKFAMDHRVGCVKFFDYGALEGSEKGIETVLDTDILRVALLDFLQAEQSNEIISIIHRVQGEFEVYYYKNQ